MLKKPNFLFPSQIVLFLLFFSTSLYAQDISVGVKTGINYSHFREGTEIVGSAGRFKPYSKIGYLSGIFLEKRWKRFFVRPEVFFTHSAGEFRYTEFSSQYSTDKLSVPLLVGYNIFQKLDVFAGPVYQNILRSGLENTVLPIEKRGKNLAAQFGVKIFTGRMEIDLRYDFNFSSKDYQYVDVPTVMDHAYFDDGRINSIMLSVNYKIFTKTSSL